MDPITMGLASGVAGGAFGLLGTSMTNSANEAMVSQQEQFAENMADTQYQRGVADLKAAGLNPMMAYMSSAAPSPQGSVAQVANPGPGLQNAVNQGFGTALQTQQTENQTKQADASSTQAIAQAHLATLKGNTEAYNTGSAEANDEMNRLSLENMRWNMAAMNKQAQVAAARADNDMEVEYNRSKFMNFDQWNQRAGAAMGTINSALDGAGAAAKMVAP